MTDAMRFAVIELVGMIDPTALGLSIQPLKKRSSSSNFSASALRNSDPRRMDQTPCRFRGINSSLTPHCKAYAALPRGCPPASQRQRSPKDSKKSFMREKKPLDCGEFSFEESFSNSSSSSRWRFVRFCGVSTAVWM